MDLTLLKDWAITVAGLIALTTFITGLIEYVRRGRQERAQNFIQMRRRFLETPAYLEILDLLQASDPALANVSIQSRRNFLGFLEEVALMANSNLIRLEIADYMFGYYVLLAAKSEHLWSGLNREDRYWNVFNKFAQTLLERSGTPCEHQGDLSF